MKILITGSLGFIGQSLQSYLKTLDYEVFGIDKLQSNQDNFECIDILDYNKLFQYLNKIQTDVVVHLAARIDISEDSVTDYSSNIIGVQNLINITENITNIKRVIWTSSQLVNKLGYIQLNNFNYKSSTSYGESKAIGEMLVTTQVQKKEWIIIRPTNVWGPNMSIHYRNFLSYVKKRKYFHITFGEIFKSYSYVENACFQIQKIISAKTIDVNKKTFYLCDYNPIEVKKWVNMFAFNFGVKKPIMLPYAISIIIVNVLDILKKAKILNKVPITKYTFQNILTQYIIDNKELHGITGDLPFDNEEGVQSTSNWLKNPN